MQKKLAVLHSDRFFSTAAIACALAFALLLMGLAPQRAHAGIYLEEVPRDMIITQVENAPDNPRVPVEDFETLGLPENERVDDSFFNDTLFVGDSVSVKLERYVRQKRHDENPTLLGNARFFCSVSLGSGNLQKSISQKSKHPMLEGQKMMLEDAVAAVSAKRMYIMLGMNDIALYGISGSVNNMMALIDKVREKSPDTEIFVESVTPKVLGRDQKTLNNANLRKYNRLLCETLEESGLQGVWFVDVASAVREPDGTLPREYCSDPRGQGIHFTDAGCRVWIDYLYTHTP